MLLFIDIVIAIDILIIIVIAIDIIIVIIIVIVVIIIVIIVIVIVSYVDTPDTLFVDRVLFHSTLSLLLLLLLHEKVVYVC